MVTAGSRSRLPFVSFRDPVRSQRVVAFNAALSLNYLHGFQYVAIDIDVSNRLITFFPTNEEFFRSAPAFRLIQDGPNASGRIIYTNHHSLLKTPATERYPITVRGSKFTVQYCLAK